MAFRRKSELILEQSPDILIIQECENEARLKLGELLPTPSDFIWIGDNETKGMAVFCYSDYNIQIHDSYDSTYQYIIPITVTGRENFLLFAIWAMKHKSSYKKSYVGQIWGAVNHYKDLLSNKTVLIGDFNSNVLWDKERKSGNHTDLVNFLEEKNIRSVYHLKTNQEHGSEKDPTFYLYKNIDKPYHLDYCFVSSELIHQKTTAEIGRFENWIKHSDHMPLIVDHLG